MHRHRAALIGKRRLNKARQSIALKQRFERGSGFLQRFKADDTGLREGVPSERRELASIRTDIDDGVEIESAKRLLVFDARGDAAAECAAISRNAQAKPKFAK